MSGRNAFPQGKKKLVRKKQSKTSLVGRGDSKCVNLGTNIKIMKSENERENGIENEKMKVKIVKMKMKVKIKVKMRIGTHRCPRCCRRLLLSSLLRSPLPSPSPPPPPFLLLPLLVDFCPSHHCRHHRPPSPSPPFLPLPLLVDCCILYLPSMPAAIVVVVARHRHHCHHRQSKPITKKRAPRATRTPPLATPPVSTHEKRRAASSSRHRARIASATPISAKAVLGLRPPPPYPRVDSPPSRCPAVADADAATTMIPCLSIARPDAATADCDPSEPHTDANAIAEGDAKMKTP